MHQPTSHLVFVYSYNSNLTELMLTTRTRVPRLAGYRLLLCCIPVFLASCAQSVHQSITPFTQSISSVEHSSQKLLLEFNQHIRELQVERAVTLKTLSEQDFTPGVTAQAKTRWQKAFDALRMYASALEALSDPKTVSGADKSITMIGNQMLSISSSSLPQATELNSQIGHIAQLLLQQSASKKAMEIASEADPSVRALLLHMRTMIEDLRITNRTSWTTKASKHQVAFLEEGADKAGEAKSYATVLEYREISDTAFYSLCVTLQYLADMHTAIAQGRTEDAENLHHMIDQETRNIECLQKMIGNSHSSKQ